MIVTLLAKLLKISKSPSNQYINQKIKLKIPIIKSVSFVNEKLDTFEIRIEPMLKEIKSIKNENEQIKLENTRFIKETNKIKSNRLNRIIESRCKC